MSHPLFTVFTPTFNRCGTIHFVYESLLAQTFRDFEWLVVDDGSSDGTGDRLARWAQEAEFPIRYVRQANGGKHTAINRGVQEARGELFLILDSDDRCVPETLERMRDAWEGIPVPERDRFSGVTVLCADASGQVVGRPFAADVVDSDAITMLVQGKLAGEKWGFHRTEVLRRFPYPVFPGERFMIDGVVWNRIARQYKMRYVNAPLRIYEARGDGLIAQWARLRARNPRGVRLYYRELLELPLPTVLKAQALVNYLRFSGHILVHEVRRRIAMTADGAAQ